MNATYAAREATSRQKNALHRGITNTYLDPAGERCCITRPRRVEMLHNQADADVESLIEPA